MSGLSHFAGPNGQVAYRLIEGQGPVILFLPGYMSDMSGTKASALAGWAQANGRACLLLDYTGCGQSEGEFSDGTLSRWRDEIVALSEAVIGDRQILLIGSSMGGWLMLMLAEELQARLAAMIGISAAPDFTDWGFDAKKQAALAAGNPVFEERPFDLPPTPTWPGFWIDGQTNRMLTRTIAVHCPVHLIHSMQDATVPWEIALRLASALATPQVKVTLLKDGDHNLSREQDLALLFAVIGGL